MEGDHRVRTEREEFIAWVQTVLTDAEIAVHKVTRVRVGRSGRGTTR